FREHLVDFLTSGTFSSMCCMDLPPSRAKANHSRPNQNHSASPDAPIANTAAHPVAVMRSKATKMSMPRLTANGSKASAEDLPLPELRALPCRLNAQGPNKAAGPP